MKNLSNIDINKNPIWDCIVVGAGPAGTISAQQIAQSGKDVLLIDKAIFPRSKVCGCCINNSALDALESADLGNIVTENNAHKLHTIRFFNEKKTADLFLPRSFSLSRQKFDTALIDAAVDTGVSCLFGATVKVCSLEPLPIVQIEKAGLKYRLRAKIVIIADGLSGQSLDLLPQFEPKIKKSSRFGASVILDEIPAGIEAGKIYMACGQGGYVGMVVLEDGRLNVAAALSYAFSRQFSGPGAAAAHLLKMNALPIPANLTEAHWTGTNSLTRARKQIADHRLFIVGDACGYTEPFTGEGMAWALWSGKTASGLAIDGINNWTPELITKWHQAQNKLILRKKRSEIIALVLRNNWLRNVFINLLAKIPVIASPLVQIISGTRTNKFYASRG